MSEAAYLVIGLAIVSLVGMVLGVVAIVYGRGLRVKGDGRGLDIRVDEESKPSASARPRPGTTNPRAKKPGGKKKRQKRK